MLPPAVFLIVLAATLAPPEDVIFGPCGGVQAVRVDGEFVTLETELKVPLAGWGRLVSQSEARDAKVELRADGSRSYSGWLDLGDGSQGYAFEQQVLPLDDGVEVSIAVRSSSDRAVEGIYLWSCLPIAEWAGAGLTLSRGGEVAFETVCPPERPERRHFASSDADVLRFERTDGTRRVEWSFDRALPCTVQDSREFGGGTYDAFPQIHRGVLAPDESVTATYRLRFTGRSDHSPVDLRVDPGDERFPLDGFGGNWCFGTDSPVADWTLTNLTPRWARVEMTLDQWEPTNDNDSPTEADMERFRAADGEGSELRAEFEYNAKIAATGMPTVLSCWHPPAWTIAANNPDRWAGGLPQRAGAIPELVECVSAYLQHAKERYGAEFDLVSFNESNIGIYVRHSPEDHRQWIRAMGAAIERLGLRTKLLLGDVHSARGTIGFVEPTANDPEAMRHVGAIAFHSWGGASPEEYRAWSRRARELGLPLLVTELGVDASAWHGGAYDSFAYGMREARQYQELLLYAEPRGTMQWEFTNDYGVARVGANGAVEPTVRYWLIKHFTDLTPTPATGLGTATSDDKVLVTAFRGTDGRLAVHIVNSGAEREATLRGLPAGGPWRGIRTTESAPWEDLGEVEAADDALRLTLPSQSVTTLTR